MRTEYLRVAVALSAVFASGVLADHLWHDPMPTTRTLGHMSIRSYDVPSGVTSLDVRIVQPGSGELAKDCVSIPGEKGRGGAGDGGAGLFCGAAVVITPGHAGAGSDRL